MHRPQKSCSKAKLLENFILCLCWRGLRKTGLLLV